MYINYHYGRLSVEHINRKYGIIFNIFEAVLYWRLKKWIHHALLNKRYKDESVIIEVVSNLGHWFQCLAAWMSLWENHNHQGIGGSIGHLSPDGPVQVSLSLLPGPQVISEASLFPLWNSWCPLGSRAHPDLQMLQGICSSPMYGVDTQGHDIDSHFKSTMGQYGCEAVWGVMEPRDLLRARIWSLHFPQNVFTYWWSLWPVLVNHYIVIFF